MDRVAAVVLLRLDGAALLQHRDDKPSLRHFGMWVPPGGHAEPGEAMLACALRELREETEYKAGSLNFLMAFHDIAPGFPTSELAIFWAFYDGLQPVVCHEGQALEFVLRSAASRLPIPAPLLAAWDEALKRAAQPSTPVKS